jgi:hypothetical protein
MTVLAVPGSPINSTAFSCLDRMLIRYVIRTLSILGTRIDAKSIRSSLGYSQGSTRVDQGSEKKRH